MISEDFNCEQDQKTGIIERLQWEKREAKEELANAEMIAGQREIVIK